MIINKTNYSIDRFHESKLLNVDTRDLGTIRKTHLLDTLNEVCIDGDILEFGVYKAFTTNAIAKFFPNDTVHGFDSFEGLPEDWVTRTRETRWPDKLKHKKGYFALDKLPQVENNVKLWKGWFDKTVYEYIDQQNPKQIKFLHVDGDLYSSAKIVFDALNDYIVKDTVILFDEFYPWGRKPFDFWMEHEYKALQEWIEVYDREFTVLSHNNHQQCAIKVHK